MNWEPKSTDAFRNAPPEVHELRLLEQEREPEPRFGWWLLAIFVSLVVWWGILAAGSAIYEMVRAWAVVK